MALLDIGVFIASRDIPSVSPGVPPVSVSSNVPLGSLDRRTVLLERNRSRYTVEWQSPSPGVYKAIPYTLVVLVPKSVDEQMVVRVGDLSRFNTPCFKPETRLEPMISPPAKIAGLSDK